MKLSDLDGFSKITIQCHDNPDPDAIASGWALTKYFLSKGCNARFIYSGRFKIQKSNLQLMLENLKIPIEYCKEYACDEDELLLTTDCQYGQGNVSTSVSANVAVIDHHQGNLEKLTDVATNPTKSKQSIFPLYTVNAQVRSSNSSIASKAVTLQAVHSFSPSSSIK